MALCRGMDFDGSKMCFNPQHRGWFNWFWNTKRVFNHQKSTQRNRVQFSLYHVVLRTHSRGRFAIAPSTSRIPRSRIRSRTCSAILPTSSSPTLWPFITYRMPSAIHHAPIEHQTKTARRRDFVVNGYDDRQLTHASARDQPKTRRVGCKGTQCLIGNFHVATVLCLSEKTS